MGKGSNRIQNRIKSLRFHQGQITQGHLAQMVGVTRQTIISIEAGKYSPSLEVAFRIATVLNLPLEEVFQYEHEHIELEPVNTN